MNSRQCSTLWVLYSFTYILSVKAIRKSCTRRFLQWGADQNRQDPWCRISTLVCAPFSQESMYNCIWWHALPVLSKPPNLPNLPNPKPNYLVSTHWDREYLLMATPLWQIRIAYSRRRWSGSAKGKDKPIEMGCRQFRPYWTWDVSSIHDLYFYLVGSKLAAARRLRSPLFSSPHASR